MIYHESNYLTQSIREVDISPETIPKVDISKCWRSYHPTKEEAELINDQYQCFLNAVEVAEREYNRLINLINKF